jgi:hypothetical protein
MSAGGMSAGGMSAGAKISKKQRGEAVRAVMKHHGVPLGQASKMVSEHLKGGGILDTLTSLAPLAMMFL